MAEGMQLAAQLVAGEHFDRHGARAIAFQHAAGALDDGAYFSIAQDVAADHLAHPVPRIGG